MEGGYPYVKGTFEPGPIVHLDRPLQGPQWTSAYVSTHQNFRYQLKDGQYAHGTVRVGGTPYGASELSLEFNGLSEEPGEDPYPPANEWESTGHGAHNEIAEVSRNVIRAHMDRFPVVQSITGGTVGETKSGAMVAKNKWRLRSLEPLKDQFKIEDRGAYQYRITRKSDDV